MLSGRSNTGVTTAGAWAKTWWPSAPSISPPSGFINRIPVEPQSIAATGIDESELVDLLLKNIFVGRLETVRQMMESIKLPYHIVADLVQTAVDRI